MVKAREYLILALDFPSAASCFEFLAFVESHVPAELAPAWVKVGLELYLSEGPSLVRTLRAKGLKVFLDLKFHDIPNTVAAAIRAVLPLEPDLLTVHASGGPAMLAAASAAATGSRTRLLAVTVLTSMDALQMQQIGITGSPETQVGRLAALAESCGINGFVCSPREADMLRMQFPHAHLVTPGIRPAGAPRDDQQRTSTAAAALRGGASQIVVGRPVTTAADPCAAYQGILAEIASAIES